METHTLNDVIHSLDMLCTQQLILSRDLKILTSYRESNFDKQWLQAVSSNLQESHDSAELSLKILKSLSAKES